MTSPSTLRVIRSREKLRESGGKMTSVRLSSGAVRIIEAMIADGRASGQTDAIEKALEMVCSGVKEG